MTKKRSSSSNLTKSRKKEANLFSQEPLNEGIQVERLKEIKPITLRLPKPMWKDIKLRTIDEERSMHAIILDSINQYLERNSGHKP